MGRKNWTVAGSDEGGKRAAAIYTLIATAKLNNVDPQAWLADVLARLPDHPAKGIHELLPWNWRPQNIAGNAELMTEKRVLGLKQAPRLEQVSDEHPSECRIASIAGMMR
jgi:IS66 C-terminal element